MGERRLPRDANGERRRRWSGRCSRRRYSPMEEMPSRRRRSLQSDGGDEAERSAGEAVREAVVGDVAGVAAMRERCRMQIRMDRDDGGGLQQREREKRVTKKMLASVPVVDVEEATMAVEKTSDVTMVLFALL
ncbi:hypothetical protein L2E82_25810 [Cichorium intybus]|uniref:Uncharacterized protein n=1 Tax=Cichorium intybus TaxID=13427 RepID=A0ACB9E551_CICIN|nr:hypothetical protein L2E82_25810 [Cichorium intybus]